MKKFLSIVLTAAMLLSLVIIVNVSTTAADGMWVTYARPSAYEEYENGVKIRETFRVHENVMTEMDEDGNRIYEGEFMFDQHKGKFGFELYFGRTRTRMREMRLVKPLPQAQNFT